MENFSIREVIEQAVQTEKLGVQFYAEMAAKFAEQEEIKQLFETLSAKEIQHEKIFAQLKDKVQDNRIEGEEEFSQYLRAIVESAFFLNKDTAMTSMKEIETAFDAVSCALGFEKETLLYYLELRDSIQENAIMDAIIQEERGHIRTLSKMKMEILGKPN
jgi:rubrerythrin